MRFMARFRRHLPVVERATGALLVLFGVLIATNSMNVVAQWMLDAVPAFQRIG
jgi:cytochrome c-type biogenesis protein